MSLDLTLPCRLIILNVQLGPAKGASTLEALVAEAIGLGHDTTESLATFFHLPEPVVGDVVHSLWNAGWIWVDFDTGRIGLTGRSHDRAKDPSNDPGARTERREYLYEPLSQLVFSHREGTRRPHRDHLEVPADAEVRLTLADTSQAELRGAVQRLMIEEQRTASESVVLSVLPAGPAEMRDQGLRWVELTVSAAVNQKTGRLYVQAADPTCSWPPQAISRLSNRLADYVERWPRSRFSAQLRGRATDRLEGFPGLERLLDRLTQDLNRTIKPENAAWRDRQKSLAASAQSINQYLDSLSLMRSRVDLLTNTPARLAALRAVLKQARKQLVVVCPAVRPATIKVLIEAGVEDALNLNVQLVLLWGSVGGDALDDTVAAHLASWRKRFPEQLIVPQTAARTAADLVIADDHAALVGSGGLLDARPTELAAAWIRPTAGGQSAEPSRAVLELLAWSRNHCPDWLLGQAVLTHAELSDHQHEAVTPQRDVRLPAIPDDAEPSMIPMWHDGWVEYRNMLAEAISAVPDGDPVVEVLLDGEIAEVIADQVAESARRLAIADDSTGSQPLRHELLDAIESRRTTGVLVQVDCPPLPDEREEPAFVLLSNSHQPAAPVRGRLVVADYQVTLGSESPLTVPRHAIAARRSQVGLRIRSRAVSDEAADWLGLPSPEGTAAEDRPEQDHHGARDALALAQGAHLARRDRLPLDAYLHQALDAHADPWPVVERLRDHGAEPRLLASTVATVLQRRDLAEQRPPTWTNWLIGHLWERGSFVAAALVCDLVPDGPQTMAAPACLLAAAIEHAPLHLDPEEVALKLAERSDEWAHTALGKAVGAAGLVADYLLGAHIDAKEAIGLLAGFLPPAWRSLASTLVDDTYGDADLPLSVLDAASLLSHDEGVAKRRADWERVAKDMETLIALKHRFSFKSGKVLYRRITAQDGIFTRLHEAATAQDRQARRAVVDDLPRKVAAYFDAIVAEEGEPEIVWSKHRTFLDKVELAFQAARAAAATDVPDAAETRFLSKSDRAAAQWLSGAWEELSRQTAALPAPYQFPFEALLRHFRPLVQWQETHT